jgi:hypothetical protein
VDKTLKASSQRKSGGEMFFGRALTDFLSGSLTVSVNNLPFLKVDGESKTLDLELKGFEESGLRLGDWIEIEEPGGGVFGKMRYSSELAKSLHHDGWRLRIFDRKDPLIAMGRGASHLTGYVWMNPLKIRKILSLI